MRIPTVLILMLSLFATIPVIGGQNTVAHLEQENTLEYSITSGRNLQVLLDRFNAAMEAMIWQEGLTPAQRRELMSRVSYFHLARELSGVNFISGIGRSSTETSPGLFHNRMFLALDPAAAGLLNALPAAENNLYPAELISELPATTALAVAVDMRPEALLDALARSGSARDRFISQFPENFPMQEIHQRTAGVWHLTILQNGAVRLDIPDPDSHLFELAKRFSGGDDEDEEGEEGEEQADDNRINTGFFTIIRGSNRLTFYFTDNPEEFTSGAKITLTAGQQAALTKLPEKCFAFAMLLKAKDDVTVGGVPLFTGDMPEIFTLSRESDGILFTCNSSNTFTGIDLFISQLITGFLEDLSAIPCLESEDEEEEDDDDDIENKSMSRDTARDDEEAEEEGEDDGEDSEDRSGRNCIDAGGDDKGRGRNTLTPVRESSGKEAPDSGEPGRTPDREDRSGKNSGGDKDADGSEVEVQDTPCQCESTLNAAKAALAANPDLETGFYVVRNDSLTAADGNERDRIAYFGKIESEIPVPVFIAMPHDQRSFCVLFSDGTIQRMRLDKADSFRRIVGFIHTEKMYDEQIFRTLMEKAAGFDAN